MAHMFRNWPTIPYDLDKKGKPLQLTNVTLRFKINQLLSSALTVIYEYDVVDGERADIIAHKYYEDASLDWLIYLTNNIVDPQFDWPMDDMTFSRYIKSKYGSAAAAKQQHHHYEKILTSQQIFFDGSIIAGRTVIVDKETYDQTSVDARTAVDSYTYELRLQHDKSRIKLLDNRYVSDLVKSYDKMIDQLG